MLLLLLDALPVELVGRARLRPVLVRRRRAAPLPGGERERRRSLSGVVADGSGVVIVREKKGGRYSERKKGGCYNGEKKKVVATTGRKKGGRYNGEKKSGFNSFIEENPPTHKQTKTTNLCSASRNKDIESREKLKLAPFTKGRTHN